MPQATLMPPISISKPKFISYEEFLDMPFENSHVEWIRGEIIEMSPVSDEHNDEGLWLMSRLKLFCDSTRSGVVRYVPFQMKTGPKLPGRSPDIMYISNANLHRKQRTHLDGPADIAIEIISPGSERMDRETKYFEYENGGVKEYWIIDPIRRIADFYLLDENGRYQSVPIVNGVFHSQVLPEFWLKVEWLWQRTQPLVVQALRELSVL